MIGSATSRTSVPGQVAEPIDEDARLVERGDDRQSELLPELEVLRAAARGDVDDAGPLVLADLGPRHDDMLVRVVGIVARPAREGGPDRGQVVERTGVSPADHLGAGDLLEHLEVARERRLAACPYPTQNWSSPWRTRT